MAVCKYIYEKYKLTMKWSDLWAINTPCSYKKRWTKSHHLHHLSMEGEIDDGTKMSMSKAAKMSQW